MYIIIYDFGTSTVKTCLFRIDSEIKLVAASVAGYEVFVSDDGGAEQDAEYSLTSESGTEKET